MTCNIFPNKPLPEEPQEPQEPQEPTPPEGKFGGNFIASTTNSTSKIWPLFKKRLEANPNWDGAALRYSWPQLERNKGEYTFQEIDKILDELKGKRLLLLVTTKTFGGQGNHCIPDYMRTAEYGDSEGPSGEYAYASANLGAGGNIPKMYVKAVEERFVALLTAIAEKYDADPRFDSIMLNELSIAKPVSVSGGWNQETAWFDSYIRAVISVKPKFAQTNMMQWINAPRSQMKRLVPAFRDAGIGSGIPDLCFRTKGFWFNPIDHPTTPPGSFWHNSQNKGKVPVAGHVSNPALDGCCAAAGQKEEPANGFNLYKQITGYDTWPAFDDTRRFSGGGTPYQTKQYIRDKSVEFLGVTHLLWAHSTMPDIGGGGTKAQTVDAWISNPESNITTAGRPKPR